MIADHPVQLTVQQHFPQVLHVRAGAYRRIDLGQGTALRSRIQHQVAYGHLAPQFDTRYWTICE